jgi:type IV pilus assembly protein PilB
MAIFEIMIVNEAIEDLIFKRASMAEIKAVARKNGMRTLEESGYEKVNLGETSLDEVLRVTMGAGT